MTTVNKRVYSPQAHTLNGIDAGGEVGVLIDEGYDDEMEAQPGDLAVGVVDRATQFHRGQITTQDWIHMIDLLTGTVGNYVFWQRKSGAAAATGYVKHTITNPKIWQTQLRMNQKGYLECVADYECMAASEAATIKDMHAMTDSQAAPTGLAAARGGWRVTTATHGSISIYHLTGFDVMITAGLLKASNDADVAYTAVDVREDGLRVSGSLSFEDMSVKAVSLELKSQELLLAAAGSLAIRVVQSAGATSKDITIARTIIMRSTVRGGTRPGYTGVQASWRQTNDPTTPLTLAGTNKIIVIADAV